MFKRKDKKDRAVRGGVALSTSLNPRHTQKSNSTEKNDVSFVIFTGPFEQRYNRNRRLLHLVRDTLVCHVQWY